MGNTALLNVLFNGDSFTRWVHEQFLIRKGNRRRKARAQSQESKTARIVRLPK
jgi:hypothetical protein